MKLKHYLFTIFLSFSMTTGIYIFLANHLTRMVKEESRKIEERILDDYTFRTFEEIDDDDYEDECITNTLINKEDVIFL